MTCFIKQNYKSTGFAQVSPMIAMKKKDNYENEAESMETSSIAHVFFYVAGNFN